MNQVEQNSSTEAIFGKMRGTFSFLKTACFFIEKRNHHEKTFNFFFLFLNCCVCVGFFVGGHVSCLCLGRTLKVRVVLKLGKRKVSSFGLMAG